MATCRLLLIRHGESVLGSQGRYAGHRDTPLTPKGRRQVGLLRRRYKRLHVDRVYSSDLTRCRQTAMILNPEGEIIVTKRLRELNFGTWEGHTHDEIIRRASYRRWLEDPLSVTPPGGESVLHLARRVRRCVAEIVRRHPNGTVALVTHGGVIRVLLAPDLRDFRSAPVPPAGMTVREEAS